VELMGIRSLTFAVGSYLSIATTLAIFAGGVVRWMVDRAVAKSGEAAESEGGSEISPGSLYASGLIAAGGIVGLLGVGLKLVEPFGQNILQLHVGFMNHDWVAVLMFGMLAGSLYYFARKPLGK
jgi:membrane protein YqaA with SNARE-associated domain